MKQQVKKVNLCDTYGLFGGIFLSTDEHVQLFRRKAIKFFKGFLVIIRRYKK